MRERGIGRRRRFMAVAAVLVALSVAAPELASPADAAPARSSARTEMQQSRPAGRPELVAKRRRKRRSKAALARRRRARLVRYLRQHPRLVASHLRSTGRKIRASALRKKPRLVRAYLKTHPKLRKHSKARVTPAKRGTARRHPVAAPKRKKKKKKVTAAALAAAKRKKKASKSHPLGLTGWGEIALLALLPLLAVGALLFITDRLRQPPAPPTPKRRRRTLVITPLSRNR
jgi:hypothetical protein